MGCIEIIICIIVIYVAVSILPYIGIALIAFILFKIIIGFIRFVIKNINRRNEKIKNAKNKQKFDIKEVKTNQQKEPHFDVDAYVRYCNAYLEHEEEMEQYKEHYNIKDDE